LARPEESTLSHLGHQESPIYLACRYLSERKSHLVTHLASSHIGADNMVGKAATWRAIIVTNDSGPSEKLNIFSGARFDVEHALGMYALSFCVLPAEGIYDESVLKQIGSTVDSCHIYLIGYTPRIELIESSQAGRYLRLAFRILGKQHSVTFEIPDGLSLKRDGDYSYLEDSSGDRHWPNDQLIQRKLSQVTSAVTFDVKYIGQAYGREGSRNAIDRLLKHETLQKISLKAHLTDTD
jgi:hypothetical protein